MLATRRPLLLLVAGTALSVAVEAFQAAVPALGRSCDANDWTMNTAGTVAAVLVGGAMLALTDRRGAHRQEPDRPDPARAGEPEPTAPGR